MNKIILFLLTITSIHCVNIDKTHSIKSSLSILQGLTTSKKSQISIVRSKNEDFIYKIIPETPFSLNIKFWENNDSVVDHLYFKDLNLNVKYKLNIYQNNKLIDQRYFKSYDTEKEVQHIAIASCMDDRYKIEQKKMWQFFINKKADLHFFIGDNVYGDKGVRKKGMAHPDELWRRYTETRLALEIYKSKNLTPTLAIWDDHDFGNNGGGENYLYKNESKLIFQSFFAQDPITSDSYKKGPGISFAFISGGQKFYFMDNRSFRTNKRAKKDYHWGFRQNNWLKNQLSPKQNFSWLINGNQFFGAYHRFESFEKNHPNDFKNLLSLLNSTKNKVAFVSGDRHLFEVMEIKAPDLTYNTFELTTSAIHAKVYPSSWSKDPNPRQLFGVAQKLNYALIKTESSSQGTNIEINGYGPNDENLYKLSKTIK